MHMAFVKIQPKMSGRTGTAVSAKITMGAYLAEGIGKPKQVVIRIPKLIMDATNFVVVDRKTTVNLHEGVGEDTGFLQLYYTAEYGGTSASQGKNKDGLPGMHGFSLAFADTRFRYYAPNEWPIASTEVNHIIDDGNLIIECPDWFRPNLEKMKADGLIKEEPPRPPAREVVIDIKGKPRELNRSEKRQVAKRIAQRL
jgi:hypothetical protein